MDYIVPNRCLTEITPRSSGQYYSHFGSARLGSAGYPRKVVL